MKRNNYYDCKLSQCKKESTFYILERNLKNKLEIKKLTNDILLILDLKNKEGKYTHAGILLSDKNSYRGIDIVRFCKNINILLEREGFEGQSILAEYDKAIEMYRKYYQHEEIKGSKRKKVETIPEKAFREAVANALVHRTWDVNAQIKISMFDDRIEITSPGGLPDGISKEEYLTGQISMLRNPIIAGVFFRLGIIEQFGTGVQRILNEYSNSIVKPQFAIFENSITVKLPVVQNKVTSLSPDEQRIYNALRDKELSTSEIVNLVGFGRTKVLNIVRELIENGYVIKIGNGRSTKYRIHK